VKIKINRQEKGGDIEGKALSTKTLWEEESKGI
jgi:hypothetical protein